MLKTASRLAEFLVVINLNTIIFFFILTRYSPDFHETAHGNCDSIAFDGMEYHLVVKNIANECWMTKQIKGLKRMPFKLSIYY